jgi:Poly(A) polymerase catalytic subunit
MVNKFNTKICNDKMSFDECELAILRHTVDESEHMQGKKIANDDIVKAIIKILENFLIRKKLICYGGTAINNILPKFAQFYNHEVEVPDYDFYSPNALQDSKELADIYHKAGYLEVEAKAGVHFGTYKVFVNFIPIADITFLQPSLFKEIGKEAVSVAGIRYAPPNFLRMNMYLELSRPAGDVSRWEKVLKRLTLLNKYYPLKPEVGCDTVDFQRRMESHMEDSEKIYYTVRDSFIDQGVIFFGGYATSLYSQYMSEQERHLIEKIPDFDVLCDEPAKCAMIVKETLQRSGFKNVKVIKYKEIGEIIPKHIRIDVNGEIVAFIYKPIACHSYNKIQNDKNEINVATIDTILTFYLAFTYANLPYYDKNRLLCMAKFLFEVEEKNRLEQKGLLKRFTLDCYGKQKNMEDIRAEKAEKFKELASKKDSPLYQQWFLRYNPAEKSKTQRAVAKPAVHKRSRTTRAKARRGEYLV